MSIRCPRRLAASRRVRSRSSGSASRAIACLAAAISAAVICAKSFFCSTSRSDTVSRASISTSDVVLALVEAAEQRLLDALRARRRRFRRGRRRIRQHGGDQLLDIAALAEENAERLVEQNRMLVPLHEHRVQRPVEILAVADARDVDRFQRIEHRAGPDRNAGRAQRAREVEDVFGEAAFGLTSAMTATPPPAAPTSPRRAAPSPCCRRAGRCRPDISAARRACPTPSPDRARPRRAR